jgi:mRNA-degrading endonuclease toxin of MazEF toxin-antitoxin module
MVRQGEVYELSIQGSRFRGLVVSNDAHNEARVAWVAPIRHGRADIPPYLIALHDTDPLGGAVDLDLMRRFAPSGEPVGTITGATLARVLAAISTVFSP